MQRVCKTLKGYLACISATCAEMGSAFAVRDAKERPWVSAALMAKMKEWQEDDDEGGAKPFDMADDLPKMYEATWRAGWTAARKLKAWTMMLVSISIFARASCVTDFCPLLSNIRMPERSDLWDKDGYPKFIEIALLCASPSPPRLATPHSRHSSADVG